MMGPVRYDRPIPMSRDHDIEFMTIALEEARIAMAAGEVPVGAVVVVGGAVIDAGHNEPVALIDPTAHAEVLAIRRAAAALGTYRLTEATLYVTLEPCTMCIGAAINARIARLCYAARDEKAGALGSVYDLGRDGRLNHRIDVTGGVMADESAALIRSFFVARRTGGG